MAGHIVAHFDAHALGSLEQIHSGGVFVERFINTIGRLMRALAAVLLSHARLPTVPNLRLVWPLDALGVV